jgi:hypothetical protein
MNTKIKNPLLAGLMNIVIPGSSQFYLNKDWGRSLGSFLLGIVAYFAALGLGNLVQGSRTYALPQGLVTGILMMVVVVVLFLSGQKAAKDHNNEIKSAAFYNSKRIVSHESDEKQYAQIQKMRDDGLISGEEYDEKNAKVKAKHSK